MKRFAKIVNGIQRNYFLKKLFIIIIFDRVLNAPQTIFQKRNSLEKMLFRKKTNEGQMGNLKRRKCNAYFKMKKRTNVSQRHDNFYMKV